MQQLITILLVFVIIIFAAYRWWDRWQRRSAQKKQPPQKIVSNQPIRNMQRGSPSGGRLNLYVGNTPPPGALTFHPDGSITRTPDNPKAQLEWRVVKMTKLIADQPDDGEGYGERALALMKLGRYAEAIPDLDKLLEMYDGFAQYYGLRGECHYHSGNHAQALDDLRHYKNEWPVKHHKPDLLKILDELEQEFS